jgi:Domain of unknown function (DUF1905)
MSERDNAWSDLAETLELTFSGDVWQWRGPAPYYFVTVPPDASAAIRGLSVDVSYGWGVIPVRIRIGETTWSTSLIPKDGGYVTPIKDSVRRAEGIADGDTVTIRMSVGP